MFRAPNAAAFPTAGCVAGGDMGGACWGIEPKGSEIPGRPGLGAAAFSASFCAAIRAFVSAASTAVAGGVGNGIAGGGRSIGNGCMFEGGTGRPAGNWLPGTLFIAFGSPAIENVGCGGT